MTPNSSETTQECQRPGRSAKADGYLDRPARRWRGIGRGAARSAVVIVDVAVVRQVLADAVARRRESESGAGQGAVAGERLAHAYLALRGRLGGAS